MNVTIKTSAEREKMRVAGRLAASVLDMIEPYVQPGVTTDELDRICHDFIVDELKSVPRATSITAAFRRRSARPSTMSSATAFPARSP